MWIMKNPGSGGKPLRLAVFIIMEKNNSHLFLLNHNTQHPKRYNKLLPTVLIAPLITLFEILYHT